MNRRTIFTFVALAFLLAANLVAAADKVIISYSSRSYAFLPDNPILLSQVRDLTLLREVQKELKLQ